MVLSSKCDINFNTTPQTTLGKEQQVQQSLDSPGQGLVFHEVEVYIYNENRPVKVVLEAESMPAP
jgi:hypothetical protein